jgi:hypothetical protein
MSTDRGPSPGIYPPPSPSIVGGKKLKLEKNKKERGYTKYYYQKLKLFLRYIYPSILKTKALDILTLRCKFVSKFPCAPSRPSGRKTLMVTMISRYYLSIICQDRLQKSSKDLKSHKPVAWLRSKLERKSTVVLLQQSAWCFCKNFRNSTGTKLLSLWGGRMHVVPVGMYQHESSRHDDLHTLHHWVWLLVLLMKCAHDQGLVLPGKPSTLTTPWQLQHHN